MTNRSVESRGAGALVSFTPFADGYYDLDRKGPVDSERHRQKVRDAIKENLQDLVSNESIITSDGQKTVKVPVPTIDLPHFRFDPNSGERVGEGEGNSAQGDVVIPGQGNDGVRKGKKAGNQPGVDYYEAEVSIDELAAVLFADLGLPNLQPKKQQDTEAEAIVFNDIRKKGVMGNLDKRRTIYENLKRNAMRRKPGFHNVTDEDLRFKTWQPTVKKDTNAVIFAMRDVSGSMGEFEKYITRASYFWMVRFLRTKYDKVEIVFITHHTEAKVVDEASFFNQGESGGTVVSSAYKLANDLIDEKYDPQKWNIYPFHYSDGDNWGDQDNGRCVELVRGMAPKINMFGYAEIQENDSYRGSATTLMKAFEALKKEPKFRPAIIKTNNDIYPALKTFFTAELSTEGAVSKV